MAVDRVVAPVRISDTTETADPRRMFGDVYKCLLFQSLFPAPFVSWSWKIGTEGKEEKEGPTRYGLVRTESGGCTAYYCRQKVRKSGQSFAVSEVISCDCVG